MRAAGATRVVVTIFVNPLQFGSNEDFSRSIRARSKPIGAPRSAQVDVVYTPGPAAMYPAGFQTHVVVGRSRACMEGPVRPDHFRGVATVVTKLFTATGPCLAAFGRKDYQQLRVVQQLTRDLDLPVTILGCPTCRERDGLAMSSRNRYLSPEQRARANAIYRGLHAASLAFEAGERSADALRAFASAPIAEAFDSIDYLTLVDAATLEPAATRATTSSMLLLAARIGGTRLIDNCLLGEECLEERPALH